MRFPVGRRLQPLAWALTVSDARTKGLPKDPHLGPDSEMGGGTKELFTAPLPDSSAGTGGKHQAVVREGGYDVDITLDGRLAFGSTLA